MVTARNGIQLQKGLSLPDFQKFYGPVAHWEASLEKARWPDGFHCPRCDGHEHGLVYGRRLKRYQCRACGHQATLTAGTIMQATELPLRVDQADQGDGHVADVGRQCRQIVDGPLGWCVEDAVSAKGFKPLLLLLGQWRFHGHETEGS